MIDALGRPQSVLLLGGTSEIALAILDALPAERLTRVVLAGRDPAALEAAAAARPGVPSEIVVLDALDTERHGNVLDDVHGRGDIDLTVLAVGMLGDQAAAEADPRLAVEVARASFTGPLSLLLHSAGHLRRQGHGDLVVLSSVAAVQARPANFVYGSAKGGLDLAARGVSDTLHGSGARLLLVRPGFVRTRMTAHLPAPPLSTHPERVGAAVAAALRRPRRGGYAVLYVPGPMRLVAAVAGMLPRPVLRRLPF